MIANTNQIREGESKSIPALFNRKEDCCGCSACYAICPKRAIVMVMDEEGFEYPQIKDELCVCCRRCIKVCPLKSASVDAHSVEEDS